jgi:hypothetical protein
MVNRIGVELPPEQGCGSGQFQFKSTTIISFPAAQIDELTGHGDIRTMAILPFTSTVMLMSKLMLAGISSAPPERTRV